MSKTPDTFDVDKMLSDMATRFLSWKLPADFSPDCGISFTEIPGDWPIGTNLLTEPQVKLMLEWVVFGYDRNKSNLKKSFDGLGAGRKVNQQNCNVLYSSAVREKSRAESAIAERDEATEEMFKAIARVSSAEARCKHMAKLLKRCTPHISCIKDYDLFMAICEIIAYQESLEDPHCSETLRNLQFLDLRT